jgi:Ca2+-binding RTX toxin-like protein
MASSARTLCLNRFLRHHISRRITILASLSGLAALLVVPAGASATPGTATLQGNLGSPTSSVGGVAGFGDTTPHAITVSYFGGTYFITDLAGLTAGTGCAQVSATSASCADPPDRPVTGVAAYGSAADDKLSVASVGPPATYIEMLGSRGNDSIVAHHTIAKPNSTLLKGEDGNDTIEGGRGADIITGGRGLDTTSYASRGASEPVNVSIDVVSGNPDAPGFKLPAPDGGAGEGDDIQVENVIGGAGNDTFTAPDPNGEFSDAGPANIFTGGPGNDRISGGPGADQLLGSIGNDKLFGGPQKDKLIGGAGRDRCVGGPSKDKAKQCERTASIK